MRAAFERVYGVEDGFASVEFSGRSDLAIITDALAGIGICGDKVREAVRRFKRAYYQELPRLMIDRNGRVLPGVPSLLEELSQDGDATLMLGPGNFRTSAGI
jgi:hypothetical protein